MENSTEAKVKDLVTDFKLDEALDLLIAQAQSQNQRKQNTLLVLKGKLAMLEEQGLAGILELDELARQKAAIAHQILDIADGSPLDHELPQPNPEQLTVQKTVNVPTAPGGGMGKYLIMGSLLLAAVLLGVLIAKSCGNNDNPTTPNQQEEHPKQPNIAETIEKNSGQPSPGSPIKVLYFPSLQLPFPFLDSSIDFRWAEAEWISDTEIKLKIRYYLTCKNNLGICYRSNIRLYVDSRPIAPTEQSNLVGWVAQDATITDDISFVFPADTKIFEIELSRDKSTWRRPFQVLVE